MNEHERHIVLIVVTLLSVFCLSSCVPASGFIIRNITLQDLDVTLTFDQADSVYEGNGDWHHCEDLLWLWPQDRGFLEKGALPESAVTRQDEDVCSVTVVVPEGHDLEIGAIYCRDDEWKCMNAYGLSNVSLSAGEKRRSFSREQLPALFRDSKQRHFKHFDWAHAALSVAN